jgi:GPH family glycoside/pentoside/hexuronide:cation symporter
VQNFTCNPAGFNKKVLEDIMETRLKFRNKLAYGAGDFGSNFCWTFVASFALIYFTDTVGLSAATIGTLLMISKILDGFTDVLMGGLIDKTKSKMGKARPWLFWSAFPLAITMVLLFNVPASFSGTAKNIYVFIVYTLLGAFFYTASNISYNTLISLATDNPKERVSMGSIRFIFAVVGAFVITGGTMVFVNMLGGGQRGWTGITIIYAFLFAIFIMITVFGVKEMKTGESGKDKKSQIKADAVGFGKSLLYLVKNKYFLVMLGLSIIFYTSSGIGQTIGIYYVNYILGDPALMGLIGLAGVIPMLVVLPMTPGLTAKFGMQKTCFFASLISIVGSVILVFSGNRLSLLMAGLVIRSIGSAPFTGVMYALIAEIVEYGSLKFGIRTDGTIYSCSSVGIKVGSGLGIAITGWLLTAGGYNGVAATQSQGALAIIQNIYLIAPLITAVLMSVLLAGLRVEKANKSLKAAN